MSLGLKKLGNTIHEIIGGRAMPWPAAEYGISW